LHFSHRVRTDGRTFIECSVRSPSPGAAYLNRYVMRPRVRS
jgi:hypothetical protein